jgi:uncharacterized protein YukE
VAAERDDPAAVAERRHRKLAELDALSRARESLPTAQLQAALNAVALPVQRFAAIFGGETFRTLRENSENYQRLMRDLAPFITPEAIVARQELAMAMAKALPDFSTQMDQLAQAMRPTLATASEAMTAYSQAVQRLSGSAAFEDRFESMQKMARTLGTQLAEVGRSIQAARLAGSLVSEAEKDLVDTQQGWLETLAEQTSRAEDAWTAASTSDDAGKRIRHLTELLDVCASILARIGANTLADISKASLFRLIEIVLVTVALFEILVPDAPSELAKEDRQALEGARRDLAGLRRQLDRLETAQEGAERRFIEPLPRGRVRRDANIRSEPRGGSPRLYRLASGEIVSIVEKRDRWRRIIYRDDLAGRLSQGWVYSTSVEPL